MKKKKKFKRKTLESVVDEYLVDQRCILYGRAFDIISSEGRDEAVEFLSEAFEEIYARL